MSKFWHLITHGNVEKDFYVKNKKQLRERNVKMLKVAFTFAVAVDVILLILSYTMPLLDNMKGFYTFFTAWYILWEILTFTVLSKNQHFAKFFYGILSGSVLTMTALAGSYYSKDLCAVVFLVFLIFIPGLYVNKPTCCVTTTVLSGAIFCLMVAYFKTDPYIISVDITNTVFSVVVGIVFNLYSINIHLQNIQSSIILKEQSTTDELTALPNRRSFNKSIGDYFDACQDHELVIIMMDIDYFKKYNDTYGHLKGDECLAMVGKSLAKTAQQYGVFVARYGGEEFIVIDSEHGGKMAAEIAEAFIRNIEALHIENKGSDSQYVTLSAGYAACPGRSVDNYMQLINMADEALYQAKRSGRNCFRAYDGPVSGGRETARKLVDVSK